MKFLILFFLCISAQAQTLKPFTTDLCTHYPNYSKAGIPRPYTQCCFRHDLEYWIGGTISDRKRADRNLRNCFRDMGYNLRSRMVFPAVRVFGKPYWGYAWRDLKPSYWEITPDQKEKILHSLSESDIIDLDSLLFIITERNL
jgi:hypothetical protein